MNSPRSWHLRTSLIWLLTIISSVTFIAVGTILMLVRLPQIEAETRSQLQAESDELAGGTESLLSTLQTQIEMIASTLFVAPHIELQSVLERAVSGRSTFNAIYQIGADGTVLRAAVGESIGGARRAELIGSNLEGHLLYRRVKEVGTPAWSDKHLSPVAGTNTVAVAVPSGDTVIVGEVPLAEIFILLSQSGHRRKEPIWIIDQRGNLLVDSEDPARVGVVNLSNLPLGTTTLIHSEQPLDSSQRLVFEGKRYDFAIAHSQLLDWAFVVRSPSGLKNPRIASTLDLGIAALLGSIVLGMLLSPLWASYLARPINAITERARRIAAGETVGAWPRSRTLELNQLSADIESMAAAIHAREEEFKTIYDASPVGISLLDPEAGHVFVRVNQALVELLGYPPEEMLGKTAVEIGLWRNPDIGRGLFEALQRDGFGEAEGWLRRRDGSEVLAAITARSVVIGGRPYTITIARDITELKRTEEALRLAQFSIQNSSDALFWIKPEGRFTYVNDQACHSLGFTRDELLSMAVWDINPDFSPENWLPHWARTRQQKKRHFETRHRHKDDTIFPVEVSVNYVEFEGQEYDFAFVRDITERKRAEKKRLEGEHKYRELVERANSIILRWSPQGEITFMNEFGLKFFGYSEEELVGRHVMDTIVPPSETTGKDLRPLMQEICRRPELFELNINENILRNGERVWITWTNKAVLDDCGQVIEVFSIGSDITERKRVEAELQRHREHLEELVAERTAKLRQAMDQLVQSEKMAALGSLVAGVAHELNTPLGNARMVASSLGEHLLEFAAAVEAGRLHRSQVDAFLKRSREAVDLLERNTARAADLINHFKQVAVDQSSTRRRSFNLRQTVEEVLGTLRPQFKRTAHRVELTLPPDLALDSYPGPLEQIIANLISNSLTHGFEGIAAGVIRINAAPIGTTHVQIDYTDDGVGIPETIQKRIFDPFFTTRMGSGGSGLGLYIVYNLVNGVLGGAIQVHSPPGHGVAFTLTLPRSVGNRSALDYSP